MLTTTAHSAVSVIAELIKFYFQSEITCWNLSYKAYCGLSMSFMHNCIPFHSFLVQNSSWSYYAWRLVVG